MVDKLFARFDVALTHRGYFAIGGQIIDARVLGPMQRNSEEENAQSRRPTSRKLGRQSQPAYVRRLAMPGRA